jgi:hypothetical protein
MIKHWAGWTKECPTRRKQKQNNDNNNNNNNNNIFSLLRHNNHWSCRLPTLVGKTLDRQTDMDGTTRCSSPMLEPGKRLIKCQKPKYLVWSLQKIVQFAQAKSGSSVKGNILQCLWMNLNAALCFHDYDRRNHCRILATTWALRMQRYLPFYGWNIRDPARGSNKTDISPSTQRDLNVHQTYVKFIF